MKPLLITAKKGVAAIEKAKSEVRRLKIGEIFGEDSLDFDPSVYRYSVKALDNVKVFAIPAANFIDVMGERVLLVRFESQIREKLSKSKYFGKAAPLTIQKIIESLHLKDYQGELVRIKSPGKLDRLSPFISSSKPLCNRLWFLLTGTISINNESKQLEGEEMLGEHSMFDEKEPFLDDGDTEMRLTGYIASISFSVLGSILSASHAFNERKSILVNERKEMVKIRLEDLFFIKNFGEGLFGPIYLVKNDETNKLFVLKCISKAIVCEKNLEKHIIVLFL